MGECIIPPKLFQNLNINYLHQEFMLYHLKERMKTIWSSSKLSLRLKLPKCLVCMIMWTLLENCKRQNSYLIQFCSPKGKVEEAEVENLMMCLAILPRIFCPSFLVILILKLLRISIRSFTQRV